MRRLALLLCLLLFTTVAFSGQGDTQTKTKPKASRARRTKPTPTPAPTDDFFADLPEAQPEPPSEWELISFQDDVAHSYNIRRISRPSPNVVKVWIKRQLYGE